MNTRTLQAVGAATLAIVLMGAGIWLSGPAIGMNEAGPARVSAGNANATDMEQRISRLEAEIGALRELASHDIRDVRTSPAMQHARDESGSAAQRQEKFKAALSSNFAAQPLDSAWALRTRIELEEQLVNTAVEQPDFPAPETTRMQCRSTTCRIEARYEDEDSALYGVQLLQSAFSSRLPNAHQYSVNNPDGSVTIVMYASKGST
jgi:hypothetical protein